MTMEEAIKVRHTVRSFLDKPIPADVLAALENGIAECNEAHGLRIQLCPDAMRFLGPVWGHLLGRNSQYALILAGPNAPGIAEKLGYCGCHTMLMAQTLGLNSWWIAGTYSRSATKRIGGEGSDAMLTGIIILGYGATQGKPHRSKQAAAVACYNGDQPDWFTRGVQAALLAPTALNRQDFHLDGDGCKVSIIGPSGLMAETDRGIVRYHFEVGAGKEHFEWV